MKIKTKLVFEYESNKYANIAYNALYPDNDNIVESHVEDNKLICYTESDKIMTVLNTLEDLIHCEKIIETTSEISKK